MHLGRRQWWIDSKEAATLKLKKINIRRASSADAGSVGSRREFQNQPGESFWMMPLGR
jgi:hypothetical protein